jgi:hypothetical protein
LLIFAVKPNETLLFLILMAFEIASRKENGFADTPFTNIQKVIGGMGWIC